MMHKEAHHTFDTVVTTSEDAITLVIKTPGVEMTYVFTADLDGAERARRLSRALSGWANEVFHKEEERRVNELTKHQRLAELLYRARDTDKDTFLKHATWFLTETATLLGMAKKDCLLSVNRHGLGGSVALQDSRVYIEINGTTCDILARSKSGMDDHRHGPNSWFPNDFIARRGPVGFAAWLKELFKL